MTARGTVRQRTAATVVTNREIYSPSPRIFASTRLSPLPQYWAARIVTEEVSPKKMKLRMNCTCPARDEAERAVWFSCPTMSTSAMLTAAVMRFCTAMGTIRASSSR